ncbi:MAG: heme-copper oxidase subunit III [Bryobacteraceae bacterium]|jgi:cytochrome c oxidase subunit 3
MPGSFTPGAVQGPPPVPPESRGWGGDDGGSEPNGRGADRRASFWGLFIGLVATSIVFVSLSAAFLARRGVSDDWVGIRKPQILWVNTLILVASSLVLDRGRHALRTGDRGRFNFWWTMATALGGVFLLGQLFAWEQLRREGVYVASNPASAFFYVLTATHALHLAGGMGAMVYVDVQALRLRLGPAKRTAIDITAVFWHFLDVVWLLLMLLFYLWD